MKCTRIATRAPFYYADYLELLNKAKVKVSIDGKGGATDNSPSERYFRSPKCECIFLNVLEDPRALRNGEARYAPIL